MALLLAVPPAGAQNTDYDADNDDLIEIDSHQKLNAIRYDRDGDGAADNAGDNASYAMGFPSPASGQCPNACEGYELTSDLDLSSYSNWSPIADDTDSYGAIFEGNGYAIRGLTINATSGPAGLFGGVNGTIRNVAVINPSVTSSTGGSVGIGTLSGRIRTGGMVRSSFVSGGTVTATGIGGQAGGLIGIMSTGSRMRASYSTAAVANQGTTSIVRLGGLIGQNSGEIIASYAAGAVTPSSTTTSAAIGGLIGRSDGGGIQGVTNSYCSSSTGQTNCIGVNSGNIATSTRYSPAQLRRPTGYATIYANWNIDLDNPADGVLDDPWDFVDRYNYPLLKVDKDGNGTPTWQEFSGQSRYVPPPPSPPPYNPAHDHPEIYQNARYEMAASCVVRTTGTGDDAVSTSTLTVDLGSYTRPVTLALSLWDGTHFRSLQSQGIAMPELRQEGQMATVEVVTDPAQTRFRIDSQYGLNLVLGYADCHTDDP